MPNFLGQRQCHHHTRRFISSDTIEKSPHTTKNYIPLDLCHLKDVGNRQYTVECSDQSICVSGYSLGLSSAGVNHDGLEWETFSTVKTLSFYIKSLLDKSSNRHHSGFVLIRCTTGVNNNPASQILVLPPRRRSTKPPMAGTAAPAITTACYLIAFGPSRYPAPRGP